MCVLLRVLPLNGQSSAIDGAYTRIITQSYARNYAQMRITGSLGDGGKRIIFYAESRDDPLGTEESGSFEASRQPAVALLTVASPSPQQRTS